MHLLSKILAKIGVVDRHSVIRHLRQRVQIETSSGSQYAGVIDAMDDFGIHFITENATLNPVSISWLDIKKIIEKPSKNIER